MIVELRIHILIIFLFSSVATNAQWKLKDNFQYRGYVKDLRVLSLADDSLGNTQSLQQNLIHNRMNFKLFGRKHWTFVMELRNRLFYGEFLKYYPRTNTYGDLLETDPGSVDMSWSWIDDRNLVAHTTIDRLWAHYHSEEWDIRFGRQRVNWGQNLVWNPNDLFNVLNFADFDYEERPGMDGVRIQRYFESGSGIELAYQYNDSWEETVAAMMYRFNKWNYDIQLIAGKYINDVALGVGWAGNIKTSGFKGEATWFESTIDSVNSQLLASCSWDYSFKKGTYLHTSFLFNSEGTSDLDRLMQLSAAQGGQLNVKSLMPNKYSLFVQTSHQFHPLLSTDIAVIYAADIGGVFTMPSIGYSLRQDLDLSLVGQGIFGVQNGFTSLGSAVFLRLKWSHST